MKNLIIVSLFCFIIITLNHKNKKKSNFDKFEDILPN
jgi:hypothetical protein